MNCYRKAFDIFEINQDDIFILLTARLIIHYLEENGTNSDQQELYQFKKIFQLLINSEELEELDFDVLFENFDHRLSLAKHLAKTMKNLESSALKSRMNTFNRKLSTIQKENQFLQKFAIKLNLRKSLSSSENLLKH